MSTSVDMKEPSEQETKYTRFYEHTSFTKSSTISVQQIISTHFHKHWFNLRIDLQKKIRLVERADFHFNTGKQEMLIVFQRDLVRLLTILEMEQSSSDGCYEMNTQVMTTGSDKDSSCGALIINMIELKGSEDSTVGDA